METGGWGSPPPGGQQGAGQPDPQDGGNLPYARCRKRTKAGVYTADITYDDLKARFNMPSQKAADSLGVGLTIFKRICRRFGLQKWPYRQLLKQRREERRKSGGGRREYSSASDSETEEEEEAGGTPSEAEPIEVAPPVERHGARRHAPAAHASRAKRQRVEHNAPHGGHGAAAAGAAAAAAGGLPGEFPPLGPPQQQVALPKVAHGGWPMQQAQQVQQLYQAQQAQQAEQLERPGSGPAVTTGWQAGISQFQRRSGLTFDTAQRGQAERSPWELPAIVGAAAGGRPAGAAIGSPSIKVEMISPRDVAGSPASFSSLLEALQRQSAHGVPLDEQAMLELKREQLLQQYSGMGPVPGSAAGAGDRNQWYNMNLAGGSTFGAGPLEQPPPLPPQAGAAGQAAAAAAPPPPQVLRPKPLQASAAVSGGTPQYAGQEQPVTSRSPLAASLSSAWLDHLFAGGQSATLPMGQSLLQLGQSGLFPNSSILQLGQSGLIPGLPGMPNSPLTSWQQQLFADTPRGLPSPRVMPPAQQAQQQQLQQQQQQQQQQAGLPPLAPRQAPRSAPQQQAVQQPPPPPPQAVQQPPPQQQQAVQQLPPQQAQQAEPDTHAEQLLRLLQPSPFDSTATAAQKAVAQRLLQGGPGGSTSPLLLGLPLPSPGSAGGSLGSGGLPKSSSSWWVLDSPTMAEAVAQPSPALQSSPAASVSAAQLEKQSNALNQLLGSLRQEISCIEAQQQRLLEAAQAQRAAEEEEQRKAAAAAAAAVAAAAADSEAAQQLENRQAQLARLQALLQQPGLTPSETHALSKLIAGVQQEIAATQARRSPPVAAAAAAPPLAAPHGGASGQRQYMRPAQQQQQQQPAPQQQPAKQQQQQQQPGGTQRSTPRTSSGGGDAAGAPAASQMLSQLIGQLQREIATIGQEPGPTDAALQAQRGTAGAAGTPQLGGSGSLQRSGSLGQRPGSSSGGCASLDVQPPVAVGTNGKPPLVQQASDSAQEWEVWQHLEGSSSLSSPALRQLLLHQLEKRAGGAALPVHAAALAVGLDGAAGGRSASGLTPITPAERDAAVAASLGLVGEPSEGQESAAAAFLARMTAVHSLQQRLVQRHQQRRQRALQLAQQRYGQLQQAVLTEREAPPSRLASLKTEHVAAAEAPAATAAAVPAAVPASLPMPSAAVAWPAAAAAEEEAEEEAAMLRHAMLAQQAQRAQQPVPAKLSGSAMALDVQRGGATSPSPFSDLSGAQGLQPPAFGSRSPSADGGRVPERSAELSFAPMARAGRQLPAVAPAPSSLPSLRLPSLQQQLPSPQQLGVRVRSPPSQPASQAPSREQSLGQQVSVGQHRSPSGGSQAQPGFLPSTGRAATSPEQAGAAAAEAAAAELQ